MARRAARSFPARKIVNYSWATLEVPLTTVAAGNKALLGVFVLGTAFEETLVRTRGEFMVASDQAGTQETQLGALGFIRVTDAAAAIGVTAIPGPVTDGDDDGWVVWQPFTQMSTIALDGGPLSMTYTVDSKAQRILREGQQFAVMVENSGVFGLQIAAIIRSLARFRS